MQRCTPSDDDLRIYSSVEEIFSYLDLICHHQGIGVFAIKIGEDLLDAGVDAEIVIARRTALHVPEDPVEVLSGDDPVRPFTPPAPVVLVITPIFGVITVPVYLVASAGRLGDRRGSAELRGVYLGLDHRGVGCGGDEQVDVIRDVRLGEAVESYVEQRLDLIFKVEKLIIIVLRHGGTGGLLNLSDGAGDVLLKEDAVPVELMLVVLYSGPGDALRVGVAVDGEVQLLKSLLGIVHLGPEILPPRPDPM